MPVPAPAPADADLIDAPAAAPHKRPLFKPGFLRRTGERVALVLAYFILAIPAGMFRASADNFGFPLTGDFNWFESIVLTDWPNRVLQAGWLQVRPLQHTAAMIYVSWFALPLLATMPLLGRKGAQPWRLLGFLMITYYAGMPFFALYPLEPPWAHAPDDVFRTFAVLHPEIVGKDSNPYASMPSLHIAMPAAASLWWGWHHGYGRALLAYTCVIGFVVVYSGDHYVADIVAGFVLAGAVYTLARWTRLPLLATRWPAREAAAADDAAKITPLRTDLDSAA
jgi:hypothetical protein